MNTRRRLNRALKRDSGVALVEGAIIIPVLVLLLFGVIEWGLYMRDILSVTESARVGARTASALPRQDGFTQTTVDAIGKAGSALPKSQIDFIYVYKANNKGYPGAPGNTVMSCAGYESSCDRFVWNGSAFVLDPSTTPWMPKVAGPGNVNACPTVATGGPPDSVGVYVQATHRWFTNLFGSQRTVRDRAVLRFEPKQIARCKSEA
jgi:hypothetical protein